MSEYPPKIKELIDNLSLIEDQQQRMDFLISFADNFTEVPAEIAVPPYPEENKIPFCESGAYVWTRKQSDGTLKFYFAVENPQGISAKALSAILDKTLSGEKPEDIIRVPDDIVLKIFGENLSMGKNMGLTGIFQKIQRDAKKYLN